ncbi:MAG: hypothetical protein FWE77_04025 [Clostridia bacterium]|nr:hypothetical protein [Clostridia bacterium]
MLTSIWLAAAGICLMLWYLVWRGPLRRALGMDPHRVSLGDRAGRWLPSWLLLAGQIAVLVGMAPLYSTALLLRYGFLPALLWAVLGSMLLASLPYLVMQWASLRSEGKNVSALMFEHLGGRGKQLLSVMGWLMSVLMLAMMVQIVTYSWDSTPQLVRPMDYAFDPEALQAARDAAEPGAQVDITPFTDTEAIERDELQLRREADWRSMATTASLGLVALSALYGALLYRFKRQAWLVTLAALAGIAAILWQSAHYPLVLEPALAGYALFAFALLSALLPGHWLRAPRDMLVGALALCLAAACVLGALFTPSRVTQPAFVDWNIEGVGMLFPFLLMTTMAGGANAIYMLSIPHRMSRFELREESGYSVVFGGTLTAGFVGAVTVIAVGQYGQLPLAALHGVVDAPRLVLGAVSTMLAAVGLPLQWASLAVTLVCVGCALGALEMSVRLGASLLHGIYFNQSVAPRAFSVDRFLAAFTTVMAALLISSGDFWMLWPLFGAASMGVIAVALLPVALWLRASGRGVWKLLGALSAVLALLSLGCMTASLLAQIYPSNNNILTSASLILHGIVIALMLGTMIHALTGIGKPPREMPPAGR